MILIVFLIFLLVKRKAVNEQNDLKVLLNIYKNMNKDKRDKAQLMLMEKKLRAELEDLKQQMRRLQVNKYEFEYHCYFFRSNTVIFFLLGK